jgi:hypothetical protein
MQAAAAIDTSLAWWLHEPAIHAEAQTARVMLSTTADMLNAV